MVRKNGMHEMVGMKWYALTSMNEMVCTKCAGEMVCMKWCARKGMHELVCSERSSICHSGNGC